MAGQNDGSGRPPVVIVRPTTSVTSGVEVTQKLVTAAVAFGDLMQGTFGPRGLDKMLYKTNGETAVTNDGAKIISELLVKHPAAKAFVQLAKSQEQACGDGVTGCVLFASELMREAGRLLEKGLHPLVLVQGYQQALDLTLAYLRANTVSCKGRNDIFLALAQTTMNGTSADVGGDTLASFVVDALNVVTTTYGTDHENVRMTKRTLGNISDTRLIRGLVLEVPLSLDRLPRRLALGRVLALTCPLDHEDSVREAEIEISNTAQWLKFIDAKEKILQSKINAVLATGATAIFCAGTIEPSIFHALVDAGCFVLGGLERSGIEDIAQATGSQMCDHLDDLEESILGSFEVLEIETSESLDGRRERLCLHVGKTSGLVTLDVGGGDGAAVEEIIRGLHDALRSTALAMETDEVVCGGGSIHMGASLAVKVAAEQHPGRERLAMEAFARALEAIPSVLAQNAGVDRLDALLALRAQHRKGDTTYGVNEDGKITEIHNTWLPAYTLQHAFEAATQTAAGLLRVDQVISSRGD